MKLISGLVTIAIAADGTKKVPPRSPTDRLKTLTTFFVNYADEVMTPMKLARPSLRVNPEKFKARMINLTGRMERAYNRDTCGFFDPSTTHGGPDPNPGHRENGKPRNRRTADEDNEEGEFNSLVGTEDAEVECAKAVWNTASDEIQVTCCELKTDFYTENQTSCDAAAASAATAAGKVRAKGGKGKKTHWERLSNDPKLKFKQMMTGTRKWADRYIGNCSGQRKNNIIKNKTKSILIKMMQKLELE